MKKDWYQSKTVWGVLLFSVASFLNIWWPSDILTSFQVIFGGWAGYGFRDALK